MQNAIKHIDEHIIISKKELDELTSERDELKRCLNDLTRMIFGSKSGRFVPIDSKQLQLFEDMVAKKEAALEKYTVAYQRKKAEKKKEQPVRSSIPAHFPRVEEIIEPDNLDPKAVKIGEEITALLEIKPLSVFARRIVRPKHVLPKSSIGIAINYALTIFDNLKEYIYDDRYEIDNNNIENAIRPLAIGRKNYLFAGSHESAQNTAMFHSFFATYRTHNINLHTWLCDIIPIKNQNCRYISFHSYISIASSSV